MASATQPVNLDAIFQGNLAQLSQNMMANSAAMLSGMQAAADAIRLNAAYALQVDNRLVTGAVAAQIAAAGEPDAFAGINAGVRTPITLDQPGAYPLNTKTAA